MEKLSFYEWYLYNEERIHIELAETGASREMDFDPESEFEIRYQEYCDDEQ